ncbi:MAG: M15 family metallopeptidase [Catenibacillus sp.]
MSQLILVNRSHPLDFENGKTGGGFPAVLVDVAAFMPVMEGEKVLLEQTAAHALQKLLAAVYEADRECGDGQTIAAVSGWRSQREQIEIYEDSLKENGEAFTRKYVAWPGCSEHQTGLAIDVGLKAEHMDFIRPEFPWEGIGRIFRRLAPKYGFVQRYTKEKEVLTGIAEEPWHFRYVGCPHAQIMTERGLCLEEYIDENKKLRTFGCVPDFRGNSGDCYSYRAPGVFK